MFSVFFIKFIKPYLKEIFLAILVSVFLYSLYYKIYNDGYNVGVNEEKVKSLQCKTNHEKEVSRVTKENSDNLLRLIGKYDIAVSELELARKNIKPKIEYINKTVNKEIEKLVYSECKIPKSGLELHLQTTKTLNESRK